MICKIKDGPLDSHGHGSKSASLPAVRHVEVTNSAPPRGPHRVVTGARQDPKRTHKSFVGWRRSLPELARLRTLAYPNAPRLRLRRRGPPSPAMRRYHAPSQHLTDSRGPPAAPRAPCPSAVIPRGSSSGEGTGGCERTRIGNFAANSRAGSDLGRSHSPLAWGDRAGADWTCTTAE